MFQALILPGEAGPAERSPVLTALLAVLKALKAEEGVLWLQLQLEAILPRCQWMDG